MAEKAQASSEQQRNQRCPLGEGGDAGRVGPVPSGWTQARVCPLLVYVDAVSVTSLKLQALSKDSIFKLLYCICITFLIAN